MGIEGGWVRAIGYIGTAMAGLFIVARWSQAVDAKLEMISWQVAEQAKVSVRVNDQVDIATHAIWTATQEAHNLAAGLHESQAVVKQQNSHLTTLTTAVDSLSWRVRMLEEEQRRAHEHK